MNRAEKKIARAEQAARMIQDGETVGIVNIDKADSNPLKITGLSTRERIKLAYLDTRTKIGSSRPVMTIKNMLRRLKKFFAHTFMKIWTWTKYHARWTIPAAVCFVGSLMIAAVAGVEVLIAFWLVMIYLVACFSIGAMIGWMLVNLIDLAAGEPKYRF